MSPFPQVEIPIFPWHQNVLYVVSVTCTPICRSTTPDGKMLVVVYVDLLSLAIIIPSFVYTEIINDILFSFLKCLL